MMGELPASRDKAGQLATVVVQVLAALASPTQPDSLADALAPLDLLGPRHGHDRVLVQLWQPDGGAETVRCWDAANPAEPAAAAPRRLPVWEQAWPHGAVTIPAVAALPPDSAEWALLTGEGVGSTLMLPLCDAAAGVIGVLCLDRRLPRARVSAGEVKLLAAVAEGVAALWSRLQARATQAEAAQHLRQVLAQGRDLVLELDRRGRVLACHSRLGPPSGGTRTDGLALLGDLGPGAQITDTLPGTTARLLLGLCERALATGSAVSDRFRVEISSLAPWYEARVVRMEATGAQATRLLLTVRDVTPEAHNDLELLRARSLIDRFFRLSSSAKLLTDFDSGQIIDTNESLQRLFGEDAEALALRSVADIVADDGPGGLVARSVAGLRANRHFGPIEGAFRRKDGSTFPAQVSGFLFVEPDGRRTVWSTIEDVSHLQAQTRALEEERRAAQAARMRLSTAIESLPDGFALYDSDDRLVLFNGSYLRIMSQIRDLITPGARYQDLLNAAVERGFYPAMQNRDPDFVAHYMAAHRSGNLDIELELSDGRTIWLTEYPTPDGGRVCLRRDMTEQRRSERDLARILASAQVGTWEHDREANTLKVNAEWATMLGLPPETAQSANIMPLFHTLVHPDDLQAINASDAAMRQETGAAIEDISRLRHADGHWVWVQARGQVVAWKPDGSPARLVGVNIDVTRVKQAEERLEQVLRGASVGLWEYNRRTGENRVNANWAANLGYAVTETGGPPMPPWEGQVHPEDLKRIIEVEEDAFARGEWEVDHQVRVRHADGHWVWVLSRGRVTRWDEQGYPEVIDGVIIDITRTKELEAALARERDTLTRLMETSVSGVFVTDDSGRILFANQEAEAQVGRKLTEFEGIEPDQAGWDLAYLDGSPIPPEGYPVGLVLASREVLRDMRLIVRHPSGESRVLSVNAAPVFGPDGGMTVVCNTHDITALIETERALTEAVARAEAASRAKSDFLARMSHEIRTPLNGVLGMADVLARTVNDTDQRQMLSVITRSAEHLLAIINDLLDLSRIESGTIVLDTLIMRPSDIVARAAASFAPLAAAKGLRLTCQSNAAARAWRLGDPRRLMQVVINLVGNALKFTERGEVRIDLRAVGDRLELEISDTGIGVDPALIPHLFEDFVQADAGTTRRYGGTGLGLSITRNLVQMMGGEVTLTSAPGFGTTARVTLCLPAAPQVLPGGANAQGGAVLPTLPPLRVLVAEDNATNRIILRAMLEALGLTCVTVENGEEALAVWASGRFDVCLLDISMPGIDGVATLRLLQTLARDAGLSPPKAIAITANAMIHQTDEYLTAGFDACLAKPTRLEDLALGIAAVMAVPAG